MIGLIYTALILWAGWYAWKRWVRPTIVIPPAVEEEPNRWNFYHLKPKLAPEPTATDILVNNAPTPVDPFGRMSDRRFRELAKEVALEGPAYRPDLPSADRYCNCGIERAAIRGFLYCPSCDGPLSDNRLEMA